MKNITYGDLFLITLSLCMIVRNEEKLLGRCLDCAAPAADEIIIVDTGSIDNTKEIARSYNALVFDFPWNNSFCDARNFSFSKASMDYCMWLDADDLIQPDQLNELLALKATLTPDINIVMMKYASGFSPDGTPVLIYYRERLIKNHAGFCWEGAVHECITPAAPTIYSPIVIEHRPPQKTCHTERNLAIYENLLREKQVLCPRDRFYYARELMYAGRHNQAVIPFTEVSDDPSAWIENRIEACYNVALCRLALGQTDEALSALFKSFSLDVPRAEILCLLGDIFREKQAYSQAVYWYRAALACKENPESGGFIRVDCYGYYPCVCLCLCYYAMGDTQKAYQFHRRSGRWHKDTAEYKYNENFFQSLLFHTDNPRDNSTV